MKILAVDTATNSCSVALTDGEHLLAEINLVSTRTHSRHLANMIRETCRLARLALAEVDAYAVVKGPGSFTGLRIGVSTVKGLAEAANRPIVGISALRALAEQASASTPLVCPLIDARRAEVYFASYRIIDGVLAECDLEEVLPPELALQAIAAPCTFVGNGAALYHTLIRDSLGGKAFFAHSSAHVLRASTVARLAWRRLENGASDEITHFVPVYLRKSDARINQRSRC
ncbi:MAG: tRNA (adenosine(37)-N6)-threonylcarbamoyltransferase complex dimerization subunit type 1 TsaB [Deltaproteobacteria bacterium]|nr:tRNA (adenosine(37)-N6)-threonylcarbamoyltransferase complex dimerization subunit type 1 TsaB [Deltaproteobacteria bacterium]